MGRTIGSKNKVKVPVTIEGVLSGEPTPYTEPATEGSGNEVREQIKQMAGFDPENLPETTAAPLGSDSEAPKKERKKRTPRAPEGPQVNLDDPMSDPVYKAAIAEMTGFGGQRLMGAPFEIWAMVAQNPELRLSKDEQKRWAGFWYVVSKKANVDPASWLNLSIYGAMMFIEQVTTRWVKTAGAPEMLKRYFGIDIEALSKMAKGMEEPLPV